MNRVDTKNLKVNTDILRSWQKTLDVLAEITNASSAQIRRLTEHKIEITSQNHNKNSPYLSGKKLSYQEYAYCAKVINRQEELLVQDASSARDYAESVDVKLGMVSYIGLPLNWPDGTPYGTICVLNNKPNVLTESFQSLLDSFRDSVESQLVIIYQQTKLLRLNKELMKRVKNRTRDLANLNYSLSLEIDKRKAAEQEIDYQKKHDISTGFYNFESFKEKIDELLNTMQPGNSIVLVQIGFANGRRLQARHGDQALSSLIVAYRERIGSINCVESFTGRIGIADLGIVMVVNQSGSFVEHFCAHISELSHSEFEHKNEKIHLHAYLGVSTDSDSSSAQKLTQHAREAMLFCKESGQKYMLFSSNFPRVENHASQLESYLLQAVRNDELTLYFQPKVDLKTGAWNGAEALIRWSHPKLGVISNESLIQMAEQNGLIFEVGNFVLSAAIEQASEWYMHVRDFKVAVNVSAIQLKNKNFIEQLQHLLSTYQLPPNYLEIEITESCLISNEVLAHQTLIQLRNLGVTLSLDDFGTGCASFSYLKKYPFTSIKIDRSFIQNISSEEEDKEIIRSIIQIAKKMNLQVTVEGIEDLEQELFAINEGCDSAQGYLYGKPMGCQEFGEMFVQQASKLVTQIAK